MQAWIVWTIVAVVLLAALDRALLACEARGWIHYRRTRPARGAAMYHMLELHSIYEPGMRQISRAKYGEEQEEDESGDPPEPGDPSDPGRDT